MRSLYLLFAAAFLSFAPGKIFTSSPQTVPFIQDWTNTGLISLDDNWNGVNGIIGYRGDNLTGGTATDPQTILSDVGPVVDVIANQSNPNTQATGGVAEFDGIANPTIALQGSGTADAPNIVLYLNTSGFQNITVAYNVRDIDGSADHAIQAVALQYRVGNSGDFINVPAGFVADATSGQKLASWVTAVNAVLPSGANNASEVQIRVITSNAVNNDEWVGIDDISITGSPIGGNSNESDIIFNPGFIGPTNINYLNYQATDITDANSLEVAQFTIRDGGAGTDADALETILTNLTLSLGNSSNLRRVALYDGTIELGEVAAGSSNVFNGLTLSTGTDGGSKTISVRVTFQSMVTDNAQFQFAVTSATADNAGSGFAAANAGGASSSITGDDNRIEVVADRLAFAQNTTTPTALNAAMSPAVTVSANDINGNRDLDFTEQIRITSSGTLTGSPVDVAAVSGLATFSTLTHTVIGTGLTLNAERTTGGDWDVVSASFDITASTTASDYFRTAQTGDWDQLSTWESSSDNSNWIAATLIPTSAANIIDIRATHTVTVGAAASADQVIIRSGGQLTTTPGTLTVNDGTGDDVIVEAGGVYLVGAGGSIPVYNASATVNINTLGILRISRTGYTGAGAGMNSSAYVYQTGAIAEYTLSNTFAASGVTFFPNAGPTTFPVFRITTDISGNIGGGSPTVFNGVFEANGNINFTGVGTKTFRNGILGTGNITGTGSAPFVINGLGAILGGSGSLTVPAPALTFGPATQVIVATDKTITGNVAMLPGTFIELGASNLTITGSLSGGSNLAYVRTNGTGSLHLLDIGAGPVVFPIGNSTYNPVSVANGSGADFSARVEDVLNDVQPPFNTDKAINRTWHIVPTGVLGVAPDVTFNFNDADDNQLANPAAYHGDPIRDVQFWHYEAGNWSAVSGAISLAPAEGAQSITLSNYYFYGPVAIAKITGPLPVKFGNIRAYTKGMGINVEWTNLTEKDVVSYSVERSANGIDFVSIGTAQPLRNDGGEASYAWLDANPHPGVNFYRIRSLEIDGKNLHSVIVRVDKKGGVLTLYPNPLTGSTLTMQIELPRGTYALQVSNAAGQVVYRRNLVHNGGRQAETVELAQLIPGIYYVSINDRVISFIKK